MVTLDRFIISLIRYHYHIASIKINRFLEMQIHEMRFQKFRLQMYLVPDVVVSAAEYVYVSVICHHQQHDRLLALMAS